MRIINYLVIVSLVVLAMSSCRKIEHLSPVPHIEFRSFTVFDSIDPLGNFVKGGRLKFYFEDGDGDLGLASPVSGQIDTVNLFFTSFRKIGETMQEITSPNDPISAFRYRIPYMERLGQNKILKGTITVAFLYQFYEPADSDVIRYDFYIKDRALNESNVVSTSEIKLSLNNIYE
jgi:hypothetical protein